MKFTIPQPLQHEHEALHERLRQATQAGGEVGEAAKTLARLMHPHFVKEDQFALPPLGLLAALARGEWNAEMAEVLTLTEQLEAELPQMLAEHQSIVAALNKLREAAARAGRSEIVAFAEALVEHARTEEEVMYPAAVLVGLLVRQRLSQRASVAAA
jgi:hemerythrin-like domain-containing protein